MASTRPSTLSTAKSGAREAAEALAVRALAFLAGDATRLGRFLDITGLGPHNLREAATEPGFYAAVLDYLLADEPTLLAFAAESGEKPEAAASARQALGAAPPWQGP